MTGSLGGIPFVFAIFAESFSIRSILQSNSSTEWNWYLLDITDGIRESLCEGTRVYYSEGAHLYESHVESLAEEDDRIAEAISMAVRSDVVFLCLGLNATLEGEEGDANNRYAGADKKDLNLPDSQMRLMEAVCGTGRPVILLLAAGSALTVGYAQEHCDAILQVWYPGQMGGRAAADLLFGRFSPSGKLPVTFYKTTEELPDFTDYSMRGRTYRYMEQEALYPFGYGLSYGCFRYEGLKVSETEAAGGELELSFQITNESDWVCDEITQIYIKIENSPLAPPHASLVDFTRTSFQPHERKLLPIQLPPDAFMVVDQQGKRVFDGSSVVIYVGGSQPDRRSAELTGQEVLSVKIELSEVQRNM